MTNATNLSKIMFPSAIICVLAGNYREEIFKAFDNNIKCKSHFIHCFSKAFEGFTRDQVRQLELLLPDEKFYTDIVISGKGCTALFDQYEAEDYDTFINNIKYEIKSISRAPYNAIEKLHQLITLFNNKKYIEAIEFVNKNFTEIAAMYLLAGYINIRYMDNDEDRKKGIVEFCRTYRYKPVSELA